jgi:hypothetical protein
VNSRLGELARRKQTLIIQCAREREEVAVLCHRCRIPLDLRTVFLSVGQTLKGHPLLVAGVSGLLISGRGRGLARTGLELLGLWKTVLPLWSWWAKRRAQGQVVPSTPTSARKNRS